jgi:hypothetical protein
MLVSADCMGCAGDCSPSQLDAVKLRCMQLLQPFVEGYMWQHGPLILQTSLQQQPPWAAATKGTEPWFKSEATYFPLLHDGGAVLSLMQQCLLICQTAGVFPAALCYMP